MGIEDNSPALGAYARNLAQANSPEADDAAFKREFGIDSGGTPVDPSKLPPLEPQGQPKAPQAAAPKEPANPQGDGNQPPQADSQGAAPAQGAEPGSFTQALSDHVNSTYIQPLKAAGSLAKDVLGGAVDATQALGNTALDVGQAMNKWMSSKGLTSGDIVGDDRLDYANSVVSPDPNPVGQAVRSVAKFVLPFAAGGAGMAAIGSTSRVLQAIQGTALAAGVNFSMIDPNEGHLSDLVQSYPLLSNPVAQYMSSHPDDTHIESRLKNVVEGLTMDGALAAATMGTFFGIRYAKNMAKAAQGDLQAAEHVAAGAKPRVVNPPPELNLPPANVTPESVLQAPTDAAKAGNVNLGKTPGESKGAYEAMADGNSEQIDQAKRGTVSNSETLAKAQAQVLTPEEVLNFTPGETVNQERMVALREYTAGFAQKAIDASKKAAESGLPSDQAEALKAVGEFQAAFLNVTAKTAEAGRLLQSFQIPVENEAAMTRLADITHMLDHMGDDGAAIIKLVTDADKRGMDAARLLEQAAARSGMQKFRDSLYSFYVNNLLSGGTVVKKTASDFAAAANAIQERAAAELISGLRGTAEKGALKVPGIQKELAAIQSKLSKDIGASETKRLLAKQANLQADLINAKGVAPGEAGQMAKGFLYDPKASEPGNTILSHFGALADSLRLSFKAVESGEHPATSLMGASRQNPISAANYGMDPASMMGRAVDVIGKAVQLPGTTLDTITQFAKTLSYRAEVRALSHRESIAQGLSGEGYLQNMAQMQENPSAAITMGGKAAADANTFTSPLAGAYKSLDDVVNTAGKNNFGFAPLKFLAPFTHIGSNMTKWANERTPLALLSKSFQAEMEAGGARSDIALAKIAVGSTYLGLAGTMAASGYLTGAGPANPDERRIWEAQGNLPYSIKVGSRNVSINPVEPMGRMLGMAADLVNLGAAAISPAHEAKFTDLLQITALTVGHAYTPDFLTHQFGGILEAIGNPEGKDSLQYIERVAANSLKAVVPFSSTLRGVTKTFDPNVHVTDPVAHGAMGTLETMINEFKSELPGLSSTLPPNRNIWSEPVSYPTGIGPAFASPFYANKSIDDPATNELVRLGYAGPVLRPDMPLGQKHLDIKMPSHYVPVRAGSDRFSVHLDPNQYDRLVTLSAGNDLRGYSQTLKESLNEMVENNYPQLGSLKNDTNKREAIMGQINSYRSAALKQLRMEDRSIDDQAEKIQQANMAARMQSE